MKNKFLMALVSLVIAVILWAYVITVISPESEGTYYNIPVVFEGGSLLEERGLMVIDGLDQDITMTLRGNRSDLNKIKSSDITVKADLSKISETGKQQITYSHAFPGDIAPNAFEVLSREPYPVTVTVERREVKNVPVKVYYTGAVPQDFIADKDNPVLSNEVVNISGPAPVVAQIAEARIQVDLDKRNESFSETFRYQLCDSKGKPVDAELITTNVGEIGLTLSIQRVKEVPLVITAIAGGGATEDNSKIVIDPPTIKVSGSDAVLKDLEEINLGTIDLGTLTGVSTAEFDIVLPGNVTNLTGVDSASVTVSFPGLMKKIFVISEFEIVGVPEGLEAEIFNKSVEIAIRGPQNVVGRMTAEDVILRVDFSGEQAGTFNKKLEIVMDEKYSEVGAIGSYSVTVTLREPLEEGDANEADR